MNIQELGAKALVSATNFTMKNGPSILTGVGIAGFGVTTYFVGRAVLRAQPVIVGIKANSAEVKARELDENYTRQHQAKELGELYVRYGIRMMKIFAPAVAVGSASAACILAAHGIMHQRQAGLIAAYAALDTGFRAYRQRVQEELGEDRELDFYRGIRRTESDPIGDDGETCIIEEYSVIRPSPYAVLFEATNGNWNKSAEYNKMFLMQTERYANDQLKAHGFVFLNDVLRDLGFTRTQAGQVVGWKLNSEIGDGHIDFGIFNMDRPGSRAFVNGQENSVLLDFNVDGVIRI